jgi:hypothetical protein
MPNDPLDEEALDISNIDTDDGADFVKRSSATMRSRSPTSSAASSASAPRADHVW